MSDYDYESDYNEMEDVPFVQMELDIRDCHQVYKALQCHVEHGDFSDEYDKAATNESDFSDEKYDKNISKIT